MANETMVMSDAGLETFRLLEGGKRAYYYDHEKKCIYGLGNLGLLGPCAPLLQRRPPLPREGAFDLALRDAEALVRRRVHAHALTQKQFDALVSFAYDRGPRGAHVALEAANRGQADAVARAIKAAVHTQVRGADGRPGTRMRSLGLVYRRAVEAAPFECGAHCRAAAITGP